MNLQKEKENLEFIKKLNIEGFALPSALERQQKLVHALEQLEQAREALEYCRDDSTDIWIARKAEAVLQALKQQEVGNGRN